MQRKMLKQFVHDFYNSDPRASINNILNIYEYNFLKCIDFEECTTILKRVRKKIKNAVFSNNIKYSFSINNSFFDKLVLYTDCSLDARCTVKLNNLTWNETGTHIDTITIGYVYNHLNFIDHNELRKIMMFVYYKYLKQTNSNHNFVQFIEFANNILDVDIDQVSFHNVDIYDAIDYVIDNLLIFEDNISVDFNVFDKLFDILLKIHKKYHVDNPGIIY